MEVQRGKGGGGIRTMKGGLRKRKARSRNRVAGGWKQELMLEGSKREVSKVSLPACSDNASVFMKLCHPAYCPRM